MTRLGVANLDCRQDGAALDPKRGRATYLFNATIAGIEKADALLLVGANPRREAAVLNARIRKRWRMGNFPIGLIGERADLTYPYDYLGAGPDTLADVGIGSHPFGATLKKAEHPLVIVGQGAWRGRTAPRSPRSRRKPRARRGQGRLERLFACCTRRRRAWARSTSGFVPGSGGRNARRYGGAGALDVAVPARRRRNRCRRRAPSSSISAPTAIRARTAPTSSCRVRPIPRNPASTSTPKAVCRWRGRASFPPGDAREDWAILRALSDLLGRKLPYDSLAHCGRRCSRPIRISRLDQIAPASRRISKNSPRTRQDRPSAVRPSIDDFYLTNPIARASAIMAECSVIAEGHAALTAAE